MAISTTDSLLEALEKSSLLDAEQLAQVRAMAAEAADARTLAKKLVALGLLTRWQSDLLLAGRTSFLLGKYKLMELLGRGGMGSVFLARHTMMNRPVALKIISKQLGRDPANLERFFTEARAVAALNHPNIVHAYNIDNEGDRYYMVMEFVEGQDLQRMVETEGPLDCAVAAEYIRQAADGLAHAHSRNIVHCDIKPANLLVNPQGVVKILDMGMARLASTDVENEATNEQVLGTVDYMAPELAMHSPQVDRRVDIYSLGCTLYFLLTGHPPFPDGSLTERILKHQMEEPRPIREERPDVSPDLVELCRRMMAKKPEDRIQSADEIAAWLADWALSDGQSNSTTALAEGESTPSVAPQEEHDLTSQNPDPFSQEVPDPLASADLAFVEEALPPVEKFIPTTSGSHKQQTPSRMPVIAVAVAGGVALVVLIAVLLMFSGGPDRGTRETSTPVALSSVSPTEGDQVAPTAHSDSTESRAAAQPASTPVKPPEQPPQETAPPKQPPAANPGKAPEPKKTRRAKKAQEPAPAQPSPPSPAGKAAEREPVKPAEPAAEPLSLPATPENRPPVAAASVDPFRDFPPAVALPLLSEQEDATQPFALGRIETGTDVDWQIELLGGDQVFADQRRYVLQRLPTQPARANWVIRQESPVVGTQSLAFDVAELWRADDASLMFQWVSRNPDDANYLRACILRIRVQNEVRDLALSKPESIPPLELNIERGVSHCTFDLKWAPPPDRLKIAITKVDGPDPHMLDPAGPVGFDVPVELAYFWLDHTKNRMPGPVYKVFFRDRGEGKYSAHLTLRDPPQNPFTKVKQSVAKYGGADNVRKSIKSERDKIVKQLQSVKDTQRGPLDEQLRKCDLHLWYLDTYEAMQGKTYAYFQVFVQVEDKQVVLAVAETPPPLPSEEKEQDKSKSAAPSK